MRDEFDRGDAQFDEAIASYPMASLPPGFTEQVMARVAVTPQLEKQFRLQFLDLALPAFIATFGTAVFLFTRWLSGNLKIDSLPPVAPVIPFTNYLETIPDFWMGIGLCVLLIEITVGVVLAIQLFTDPPRVTLQAGH